MNNVLLVKYFCLKILLSCYDGETKLLHFHLNFTWLCVCVWAMKKKKQKAKKFDLRQIHGNFCSSHWTQVNKKIDWNSRFSKHVTNHFMFFRVVVVVETGKITSCTKLRTLVHCIVLHWYILHVEKNQQNFTFRQRLCRERITTHSKRKKNKRNNKHKQLLLHVMARYF